MYHVPIYSSCSSDIGTGSKYWVPLFDKYKVMTSFENHVHTFKRTFPLKNGAVDANGTTYLGDGTWGVLPNSGCIESNSTGILAAYYDKINFFWRIDVNQDKVIYTAIDSTGAIVDSGFSQNIANYN